MPGENALRPHRCAVIGAGVLGACVAVRLAEAGIRVTLLEQAQPGHAATRSSFAWLNANDKTPRAYHDLNHAGIRAWAALSASLSGVAWYRPVGNIEWAATGAGRAQLTARVRRLAGWGYPARLIDAAEAAGLEPSLRLPGPACDFAWFPDEGYLLTEPLIRALGQAGGAAWGHLADRRAGTRCRPGRSRWRGAGGADRRWPRDTGGRGGVLRWAPGSRGGRAGRRGRVPGAAPPMGSTRGDCTGASGTGGASGTSGPTARGAHAGGVPAAAFSRAGSPGSAGRRRGSAYSRDRTAALGGGVAAPGAPGGPRAA